MSILGHPVDPGVTREPDTPMPERISKSLYRGNKYLSGQRSLGVIRWPLVVISNFKSIPDYSGVYIGNR